MTETHLKTAQQLAEIANRVPGTLGLVVEDLTSGERFAVQPDRQFSQASAIKVPLLLEVLKQCHAGRLGWDDRLWIEKAHQTGGSGILGHLGDHTTQMSIGDLCVMMIVLSDNTATNLLIDQVGRADVNHSMAELGCPQTMLQRKMMDMAADERGEKNLSTPADAARILRHLYEGKFVNREISAQALAILRIPKSTDVTAALPVGTSVANKPGEIPGVVTEWAIVELPRRPFLVVAMAEGSDDPQLHTAVREIAATAYGHFRGIATPDSP